MIKEKEEVWKTMPGYDKYMISDRGEVKSLKFNKERLLKQASGNSRYLRVVLWKEGKQKSFRVHVLVVMAFLGHVPCGMRLIVDHIDGNKMNNNLSNLQLITQRENASKDRRGGSSKYVGVYWSKHSKKWAAQISINGKSKRIGHFTNELEAHNAYQNKLKEIQT